MKVTIIDPVPADEIRAYLYMSGAMNRPFGKSYGKGRIASRWSPMPEIDWHQAQAENAREAGLTAYLKAHRSSMVAEGYGHVHTQGYPEWSPARRHPAPAPERSLLWSVPEPRELPYKRVERVVS